ncbi:Ribonuclease HI-like protein [Drosera capensis]
MGEERRAFYVVRKGDVIGVYTNFADCQAQAGYSPSNPSVMVYKGYGLSKEAEAFLASRGLKNASYTMAASELQNGLFGSLAICSFQDASSSSLSSCKSTKEQLGLGVQAVPVNAPPSPHAVYSHNRSIKLENHVIPQGPGQNDYVPAYRASVEAAGSSPPSMLSAKEDVRPLNDIIRELEAMNIESASSRNQEVYLDKDPFGPFPGATLPAASTISDFQKFDGTTDPDIHLKNVLLNHEHIWSQQRGHDPLLSIITHESGPIMVDLSGIDLETNYQNPDKTFTSFIMRWRKKAAQMLNPLDEKDQINIIWKNLLSEHRAHMKFLIIVNFDHLTDIGAAIEQAIRNGKCGLLLLLGHIVSTPSCIIEFDGASKGNPGPAGAGAIVRAEDGTAVWRLREGVGIATNNVAEYRAVILGLKYALNRGYKHVRVRGDSLLVCKQIEGLWKTKNQNMADLCGVAKELKNKFVSFRIEHVMREFNAEADAQANKALNLRDGETEVDFENSGVHRA